MILHLTNVLALADVWAAPFSCVWGVNPFERNSYLPNKTNGVILTANCLVNIFSLSPLTPQTTVIMYDAARVPSPKDGANGLTKPAVPAAGPDMGATTEGGGLTPPTALQAKTEEGQPGAEEEEPQPVLVKKPRREILDHDRKRRVELKCMELQEMMEEQG